MISRCEKFGSDILNRADKELKNPFWSDVFKHCKLFCAKCNPQTLEEILSEPIFYNPQILRDKSDIHQEMV